MAALECGRKRDIAGAQGKATREGLQSCKARGVDFKKAASANTRVIDTSPLFALTPLVQMQYRTPSIKQFF
jgi:hypothetical protein